MRCRLSARAIPDVGAASRPLESPAPGRVTFRSACSSSWTATRGSRPAPPAAACSSTPARHRRKSACGTYPAMMRRKAAWGEGLGEGTGGARFENDACAGAEEIRESWLGTHLLAAPRRGAGDEVAVHALTADEDLERHVDASDWEGSGGGTGRGERGSGDVFAEDRGNLGAQIWHPRPRDGGGERARTSPSRRSRTGDPSCDDSNTDRRETNRANAAKLLPCSWSDPSADGWLPAPRRATCLPRAPSVPPPSSRAKRQRSKLATRFEIEMSRSSAPDRFRPRKLAFGGHLFKIPASKIWQNRMGEQSR